LLLEKFSGDNRETSRTFPEFLGTFQGFSDPAGSPEDSFREDRLEKFISNHVTYP